MKKNAYMYNCVTLLYRRIQHNTVNQVYSIRYFFFLKKGKERVASALVSLRLNCHVRDDYTDAESAEKAPRVHRGEDPAEPGPQPCPPRHQARD